MAKRKWANYEEGSADFLEKVYFQGLAEIMENNPNPREGKFGKTTMICVVHNGNKILRFMCFAKDFGHPDTDREIMCFADFLIDDDGEGRPALFLEGCAMSCDLPEKMFRDVIAHWPSDTATQGAMLKPSNEEF